MLSGNGRETERIIKGKIALRGSSHLFFPFESESDSPGVDIRSATTDK